MDIDSGLIGVIIGGILGVSSSILTSYITNAQSNDRDLRLYRREKLENLALMLTIEQEKIDNLHKEICSWLVSADRGEEIDRLKSMLEAAGNILGDYRKLGVQLDLHGKNLDDGIAALNESTIGYYKTVDNLLMEDVDYDSMEAKLKLSKKAVDKAFQDLITGIGREIYG